MSTTGSPPLSAVEALLPYGGDYSITPTGDLAVIQDQPNNPQATIQRVIFLVMTNPAIPNILGTQTSMPDDPFNPQYGSGARAYVGRTNTVATIDAVKRNIQNALAGDPFISQNPKPVVNLSPGPDPSTILCQISFTTVTGQNATVPDLILTPFGGS